jgi:uncharacterized membrane protein
VMMVKMMVMMVMMVMVMMMMATENSAVTRMRIKHKSTEDHRIRESEDDRIRG